MRTLAELTFPEATILFLVAMAIACFVVAIFKRRPPDNDASDF
jgi:hypothetical protein